MQTTGNSLFTKTFSYVLPVYGVTTAGNLWRYSFDYPASTPSIGIDAIISQIPSLTSTRNLYTHWCLESIELSYVPCRDFGLRFDFINIDNYYPTVIPPVYMDIVKDEHAFQYPSETTFDIYPASPSTFDMTKAYDIPFLLDRVGSQSFTSTINAFDQFTLSLEQPFFGYLNDVPPGPGYAILFAIEISLTACFSGPCYNTK